MFRVTGTPDVPVVVPPTPAYVTKVLGVMPSNLKSFWVLNDTTLPTAVDQIATARNGTYVGSPTLNSVPGPDGSFNAPVFNGTTQYVNIQSASLASVFSTSAGALMIWVKMASADWSSATAYEFVRLFADNNNAIQITKNVASNVRVTWRLNQMDNAIVGSNAWWCFVFTWNIANTRGRVFFNGTQQGFDNSIAAWTGGALVTSLIGAAEGPILFHKGNLSCCALWDIELTPAQVATISVAP
jgi:hypothetical protein